MYILNKKGVKLNSIYTKNQSKDKITHVNGLWLGSLTCYNNDDFDADDKSEVINLTGLESMWYNHEENINHPEGSEFPTGVNHAHRIEMVNRVADSVLHRTGINIKDFDNVIHASTSPAKDSKGNIIK